MPVEVDVDGVPVLVVLVDGVEVLWVEVDGVLPVVLVEVDGVELADSDRLESLESVLSVLDEEEDDPQVSAQMASACRACSIRNSISLRVSMQPPQWMINLYS